MIVSGVTASLAGVQKLVFPPLSQRPKQPIAHLGLVLSRAMIAHQLSLNRQLSAHLCQQRISFPV